MRTRRHFTEDYLRVLISCNEMPDLGLLGLADSPPERLERLASLSLQLLSIKNRLDALSRVVLYLGPYESIRQNISFHAFLQTCFVGFCLTSVLTDITSSRLFRSQPIAVLLRQRPRVSV